MLILGEKSADGVGDGQREGEGETERVEDNDGEERGENIVAQGGLKGGMRMKINNSLKRSHNIGFQNSPVYGLAARGNAGKELRSQSPTLNHQKRNYITRSVS